MPVGAILRWLAPTANVSPLPPRSMHVAADRSTCPTAVPASPPFRQGSAMPVPNHADAGVYFPNSPPRNARGALPLMKSSPLNRPAQAPHVPPLLWALARVNRMRNQSTSYLFRGLRQKSGECRWRMPRAPPLLR